MNSINSVSFNRTPSFSGCHCPDCQNKSKEIHFSEELYEPNDEFLKNTQTAIGLMKALQDSDDIEVYEGQDDIFDAEYKEIDGTQDGEDVEIKDVKDNSSKKNVLGIAGSFALATGIAFAAGKCGAKYASTVFESLPSNFEKGLRLVSNELTKASNTLSQKENKYAKMAGDAINKATEFSKKGYSKISKGNAEKGLKNTAGIATMLTGVPYIVTRDNNEDGTKDFAQKGINVYEGIVKNSQVVKTAMDLLS